MDEGTVVTVDTGGDVTQEEREEEKEEELDYGSMDPSEVFKLFDTDGSGLISLEEFRMMLPKLGIRISDAKAAKYFRLCDADCSGEIDLEEFEVAMFTMDPTTGNSTGFCPNSLLTPSDAFEMFDEDGSGTIDEDEFFFVIEYLGLDVSDQKQERLFAKYDKDGTGSIDYEEFKQIWISVADVRKELKDRGLDVPKFATKRQLQKMLAQIIDDEEEAEKRAMAEAEQWRQWRGILDKKRSFITKARYLAQTELTKALDAAGQVYVFGSGSTNQFQAPAVSSKRATKKKQKDQTDDELISALWKRRITAAHDELNQDNNNDDYAVDKDLLKAQYTDSPFQNLCIATNTARLWGKRVSRIAFTDSVLFAISDLGDLWSWGGSDHWWYHIEPDAQAKWRGHTTPRSQMLLGTAAQQEAANKKRKSKRRSAQKRHARLETIKQNNMEDDESDESEDDDDEENNRAEALRTVLTYLDAWSPAPADVERSKYYTDVLLPKVGYSDLSLCLQVRGKVVGSQTKREMAEMLFKDMRLERRVLGERTHRRIRELELEIKDLAKRRRQTLAKRIKLDIQKMWAPLREIQAEEEAQKRAKLQSATVQAIATREKEYEKWRQDITKARREQKPEYTPRGNSLVLEPIGGITARGPKPKVAAKAYQATIAIAGGAQHVAVLHQSGSLYTWGCGGSGRLGHSLTQNGNPRADAIRPTLVQAFNTTPIIQASCGYSHTACITASRKLYMWGSAASGKLGVAEQIEEECFTSVPVCILARIHFRHVSCGSAHTAACAINGQLYVWGCGDGGRLGLGVDAMRVFTVPTLVKDLIDIEQVACGNTHTLALSKMCRSSEEDDHVQKVKGGIVHVAGSAAVLGFFSPTFTSLPSKDFGECAVSQVSAGFAHSGCVTVEGELYLWGSNDTGCCAAPVTERFVDKPRLVRPIYAMPGNLALGKVAKMSSCYGGLDANLAVDGNCDGSSARYCASTQQDPQAWWQVDLGEQVLVHSIKLWNRTDQPVDPAMPRDKYSSRLFPSWLMVSQRPYEDMIGGDSLARALSLSSARTHVTKSKRCTHWQLPENTSARYVRLQLENFDFLHIAQIEVFGIVGKNSMSVGRCAYVDCGRQCTAAVVEPLEDPKDIEIAYKRAVQADARNADILRQHEMYALEYDKFGREIKAEYGCINCIAGGEQCAMCQMRMVFKAEFDDLPLGTAGRCLTLDEISKILLTAPKPKLNYTRKEKVDNSFAARLKRTLAERTAGSSSSSMPPLSTNKRKKTQLP